MTDPLPLLPLILHRTPPALEQILMQEGVPFRKIDDLNACLLKVGRFVLFDSRKVAPKTARAALSPDHSALDVDAARGPSRGDPFADLIDMRAARKAWTISGFRLIERVSRVDKAAVRRRVVERLRRMLAEAGGVWARLAAYPHPYRSAFNFRADLDEPFPDDYAAFAEARRPIDDCSTHFVSTAAYGRFPRVLADLRGVDTQSHGHHHVIYRSEAANRKNLGRAHDLLCKNAFTPAAFAAPEGRWNPGLDRTMETLGYRYSSDFSIGYGDLPSRPWVDGRRSNVLQIPVHPICEGLFLDAGCSDPEIIADHLISTVRRKVANGDPAFVYGHPERRLGRFPQVVSALAGAVSDLDRVWRVTLTQFADWWTWRGDRRWSMSLVDGRYEVRFADWDARYPLALEVVRGDETASIALTGPRQIVNPDDLRFARRVRIDEARPSILRPALDPKSLVRAALDWETVTPPEELPNHRFGDRVKRRLREFKADRPSRGVEVGPPRPGCVLVHAPSFAFQSPGGGENQLIQTSRHLQDLGVEVRPFSPWTDRIANSRLLHLFGMSREGLELARVAKAKGVPVALSPICWFEPGALLALAPNRPRAALDLAKWAARRVLPRLPDWRRELLKLSDAILPNSRAEASQLVALFGADRRKIHVVPNGVDPRFASSKAGLFRERFGDRDFVLYVGRIEPRKNVLGLIRAARKAGLPLVAIGSPVAGHESYHDCCRSEGGASVTWIDRLDHADPLLGSAMAAARVFALPSWFETPGLAALEAASAGCRVVITPYGCTREYFGDSAEYARPNHEHEIVDALKRAWDRPAKSALSLRAFSWAKAAFATKEAYDRIAP